MLAVSTKTKGVILRGCQSKIVKTVGYIHACFLWAHEQINMAAHWEFVLANFSGVLCIDEVHDSGRTILFATDPLGDFTVSFTLVETNDQDHMNAFLQALKDRGLDVQVAMTDGSPLYKDSLQRYWTDIEHQLCIFHVIKGKRSQGYQGSTSRRNGGCSRPFPRRSAGVSPPGSPAHRTPSPSAPPMATPACGGNVRVNTVPWPTTLSTVSCPPWAVTISCVM
jgi:hypothetical protein